MQHRLFLARRLTCWGFVAALLLKSAVPMLASAAAALQGKALAEVCDVYGVDTSSLVRPKPAADVFVLAPALDGPLHAHHEHGVLGSIAAPATVEPVLHASERDRGGKTVPAHAPSGAHGGDHCALSALAFALAADPAPPAPPRPASAPALRAGAYEAGVVDLAARWAAQLRHGPPTTS